MENEKTKEKIIEILTERYKKSGGHNGIYIVELNNEVGAGLFTLTKGLRELLNENKIRRSEGAHGDLYLLNRRKIKPVLKPKK